MRIDLHDRQIVEGPPGFENLKRYEVRDNVTDDDVGLAIEDCISQHGKVLWVCNRVDRATYLKIGVNKKRARQ